jgi:type II secretory pathway component GspD/PulD (secretin)
MKPTIMARALRVSIIAASISAMLISLESEAAQEANRDTGSKNEQRTYASVERADAEEAGGKGMLQFTEGELDQVFAIYQELSKRAVIKSGNLPQPRVTFKSQAPLGRRESLQALDTVLAAQGVAMIPLGSRYVKAVPVKEAMTEAAPIIDLPREQLPESHSYICYVVEVKNLLPRELAQALQPFAKLPNSILAIDSAGILVLRDYSVNVRRMLEMVEKIQAGSKSSGESRRRATPRPLPPPAQPEAEH